MYDLAVLSVVLSVVAGGTAALWLLARHDAPSSAFIFGIFLLLLTVWTATHLGTLFAGGLRGLLFFKQLSYIGVVTVPVAWFVFSLQYTDRGDWLSRRRLLFLSVVPATTLTMVFTAQYHSLFYTVIEVGSVSGYPTLETESGPFHILNVIYSYALLLAGTGLLGAAAVSDSRLYRRQSAVLIVCVTVPWVVNMSYHLGLRPFPGIDVTPMAFILTGIPLAAVVLQTDLASFLPVAHERVFRSLDDLLLVVSPAGQIIDANDRAHGVLGDGRPIEGTHVRQTLPSTLIDGQRLRLGHGDSLECAIEDDGVTRQYLVRRQSVDPSQPDVSRGSVLILTDITDRKEREQELQELSDRTRRKNEQLERMANVISHDMAAPLSTAEKTLSLLHADLDDPDATVEQSLEDLETVHDRLRGFADHLPRLARESIDVETTQRCDLATIAESAWGAIDTGDLGLKIVDSRPLDADRQRFQQVFENCFRNTVEHATVTVGNSTTDGGQRRSKQAAQIATTVRVGTSDDGIFIEDDGPGISTEQREHVFEYGMSTADSSGFGLAIVRTIVEAHGWEIEITDSASGGARFEIHIEESAGS